MIAKKIHEDISLLLAVPHIGIDEAGRGCLAGPVVAAAVLLPPACDIKKHLDGLTDSKKVSPKKREALAPCIKKIAISYGVGLAWPEEIDQCNIVSANYRAMTRAIVQLVKRAEKKGVTTQRKKFVINQRYFVVPFNLHFIILNFNGLKTA